MATDSRINELLETLKSDLKAMRSQDVKLMRQLININETIQTLTKCRTSQRYHRKRVSGPVVVPSATFNRMATPLIRQQSAPSCKLQRRDSMGSSSSFEDYESSLDDVSEEPYSESDDFLDASTRSLPSFSSSPRSHSFSFMAPRTVKSDETDDKRYEDILMTNIKLWKYSNKEHFGSMKLLRIQECALKECT